MKNTLMLVADPEIPRTVRGHRMHHGAGIRDSAGINIQGDKPAVLEVGNPAQRGRQNSPMIVLKQRLDTIIRQSISLSINGNLSILPSVQAIDSPQPNAAIVSRRNR